MSESTSVPLLTLRHLEGPWFKPISLEVEAGKGVLVQCPDAQPLDSFIDIVSGLAPPNAGEVKWFGNDLLGIAEPARHKLRHDVAYSTGSAGLISNLKIWENIVLPLQARGLASSDDEIDRLEERLVEVFGAAGYQQDWIGTNLRESTDRLSDFERIVCGVARCYLAGFRLLVADRLFDGIDNVRAARLSILLDWVATRMPDSGVLLLHHGPPLDGAFGLRTWEPVEIVSLEPR